MRWSLGPFPPKPFWGPMRRQPCVLFGPCLIKQRWIFCREGIFHCASISHEYMAVSIRPKMPLWAWSASAFSTFSEGKQKQPREHPYLPHPHAAFSFVTDKALMRVPHAPLIKSPNPCTDEEHRALFISRHVVGLPLHDTLEPNLQETPRGHSFAGVLCACLALRFGHVRSHIFQHQQIYRRQAQLWNTGKLILQGCLLHHHTLECSPGTCGLRNCCFSLHQTSAKFVAGKGIITGSAAANFHSSDIKKKQKAN